jgi:signal transduction histidine kinase
VSGSEDDYHAFTEEQIELACGLADTTALTLENARLHEQVRRLAVLEERDRLAREMHDSLAQTVGTLNLKASLIQGLLSSGQIAQAQAGMLELKNITNEAYLEVRESIFGLRGAASLGSGLLPTLQEYLAVYRTHYGVDARLEAEDELLARFPMDVEIQIIRIIQEALTNVRKHAGASKVRVVFKAEGDQVRINVEDDGQGFDLAQVSGEGRHYFGLQIMRERAEDVGGSIKFDSRPGQGTRVVVRVPLAPGA